MDAGSFNLPNVAILSQGGTENRVGLFSNAMKWDAIGRTILDNAAQELILERIIG